MPRILGDIRTIRAGKFSRKRKLLEGKLASIAAKKAGSIDDENVNPNILPTPSTPSTALENPNIYKTPSPSHLVCLNCSSTNVLDTELLNRDLIPVEECGIGRRSLTYNSDYKAIAELSTSEMVTDMTVFFLMFLSIVIFIKIHITQIFFSNLEMR